MERKEAPQGSIETFRRSLLLRGLSRKTVDSYALHVRRFLQNVSPTHGASREDVEAYILSLSSSRDPRTVNLAIAAIKAFLKLNNNPVGLRYLKRPKRLPEVLAQEEVLRMLSATANPKHRLVLQLLYGCGLRLSEVRNLRKEDVRPEEGVLFVRQGKGGKDRIVSLPASILRTLQPFLPEDGFPYLLRSERGGRLHPRTIEQIVKNAARNAGVRKRVHPHTLRHSYATHLLEGGTDLRIIQRLLGHSNVKATEIYTHVSAALIKKIVSPLDTLTPAAIRQKRPEGVIHGQS